MMRPTRSGRWPPTPGTRCSSAPTSPPSAKPAQARDDFEGSTRSSSSAWPDRPLRHGQVRRAPDGLRMRGVLLPIPIARQALLPFEVATGRLVDEVWERWLELDRCGWRRGTPTRCARCDGSTSMPESPTSGISTSAPRPSPRARQARGRSHAGAVRRQARRPRLPLPGRDSRVVWPSTPKGRHGGPNFHMGEIRPSGQRVSGSQRLMWMPIRSGRPLIARVSRPGRRPSSSRRSRRSSAARTTVPPA
jgi:hypothetical protein